MTNKFILRKQKKTLLGHIIDAPSMPTLFDQQIRPQVNCIRFP